MKKLIILIFLSGYVSLLAQESAINFIIPKVSSSKKLYATDEKSITEDFSKINTNFLNLRQVDYQPIIENNGSITYKVIYYKTVGLATIKDYAYFISFAGNKAILKGFSKYIIEKGLYDDKIVGENYTQLSNSQSYYIVPSESYQNTEWVYTDPNSGKSINAKGSYKTMNLNGKEERIFIVEHTEKGIYTSIVKTEYFLKNFGLIGSQISQNESFYIADLIPFNLFSDTYFSSLTEDKLRSNGWGMIRSLRKKMKLDDELSKDDLSKSITMDSLVGLYQHMMMRYPAKENLYRYILSLVYNDWANYYYFGASKDELKTFPVYSDIMENLNSYYLMRLTPDYIPKSDIKGFVTNIDEDYYEMYWYNQFVQFSAVHNYGVRKDYFVYLFTDVVGNIERNETTIDSKNLFFLHSFMATYYVYAKDNRKAYYNYVLTLENYKALSNANKDINIEYMKSLMKEMIEKKPSNETDLIRGINAALNLNDNLNALKIAENGYSNGVGVSLDFSMLFAKVAYANDIDKPYLRKAMQLMQDKISLMSSEQIKNYLIYCKAMSPEFDCAKAETEVHKIEKREAEEREKKLKEDKKTAKKTSYSRGERSSNLAIAFNPFAGLNMTGKGNAFKFMPMSVELRTGKVIHEIRVNSFLGFNPKNRFVGGKIIEDLPSYSAGWKNLVGTDYSYGIYFTENRIKSYDKRCESTGGGFQFLYGNFTCDAEQINVVQNTISSKIVVKPEITRMEILLNMKGNIYNWKTHLFITGFWGIGAGTRSITYNSQNPSFTQADLADETKTIFDDKRYVQANWKGYYFTMRMGLRFGLTLF